MANPDQWAVMREFITGLERKFRENREVIEAGLRKFAEGMEQFAIQFREAEKTQARLFPKLRDETGPLAKRGWFISGYFGFDEIMELARLCGALAANELDDVVIAMYRSSFDEHLADLIRDYPERSFAIKPAGDAHRRGEFALSVPVFFAQAEGICFEVLNKYIFTNTKAPGGVDENIKAAALGRLERSKANSDIGSPFDTLSMFMEIMWLPFAEPLPVGYGPKDRRIHNYKGLNRNTLMHGLDLEGVDEIKFDKRVY